MSKLVKALVSAAVLSFSFSVFAADMKASDAAKADADKVNTACAAEAKTANCGADKVGSGLLKCIHEYKEAHHDFKVSEGCHDAMKALKKDAK